MAKKKDNVPIEKWSPENHERWKQAARKQLTTLFSVLKRQKLPWSDMGPEGSDHWHKLDKAIASRLLTLRANEGCPEALMYLGYAVDMFVRARKAQPNMGGESKVDEDIQIVHDRIMDTLLVADEWKAAKDQREHYHGSRPSFLVELEGRLGIESKAPYRKKAVTYFRVLQQRHLATR